MMDDGQYLKRTNPDGNIKVDKEKSTKKTDGVIATIIALDRSIWSTGWSFRASRHN